VTHDPPNHLPNHLPHVCDYVDPAGLTTGWCHLRPPHGGRCPRCGHPARDCGHQPALETERLCAARACLAHDGTEAYRSPFRAPDSAGPHLPVATGPATDPRERRRSVVEVDLAAVPLRFPGDGLVAVEVQPGSVLTVDPAATDDDPADPDYPVLVIGEPIVELTRAEALATAAALLALVRELDRAGLAHRFATQAATRAGATGEVAAALDRLDGTPATAVARLTGLAPSQLVDLGGVPPDPVPPDPVPPSRPDPEEDP
jgi:hypothetical protein